MSSVRPLSVLLLFLCHFHIETELEKYQKVRVTGYTKDLIDDFNLSGPSLYRIQSYMQIYRNDAPQAVNVMKSNMAIGQVVASRHLWMHI